MDLLELAKSMISKTSLEVLTALATTGATFFAWQTTVTNKKQAKEQIEEQHRVERPRLVPLNKDVIVGNLYPDPNSNWNISDPPTQDDSHRSNELDSFYFILINTGKSFALKIELKFELIGGIGSIHEFEGPRFALKIDNPGLKQLNPPSFTFTTVYQAHGGQLIDKFTVDSFQRRLSLLKSNESTEIRLPKYFVKLSNFYVFNHIPKSPQIKLTIDYVDQYHEKHNDIYIIGLKRHPLTSTENDEQTNVYEANELYLDFKNITPNTKKKPIFKMG